MSITISTSASLSRFLIQGRLTEVRYEIVINGEHFGFANVWSSLSYRIQIMRFTYVRYVKFGVLVKFLRYRPSELDRVPIIRPALRGTGLDCATNCQNHEENHPVRSKACETSSKLVRKGMTVNYGVTVRSIIQYVE